MEFASTLFAATERAYRGELLWPSHPLDDETLTEPFFTDLYFGALGNAVAMDLWTRRTGERFEIRPRDIALQAEHVWRAQIKDEPSFSYFFGETGFRIVLERMSPDEDNRGRLRAAIRSLAQTDWNEILYGSPGGLLAAQFLYEESPEPETERLIRDLIVDLFEKWLWRDEIQAHAWTQNLGKRVVYFGAAHGAVGNIRSLLRAGEHLTEEEREALFDRTIAFVKHTAMVEDKRANWRTMLDPTSAERPLVHWCHGAPGFLTSLALDMPTGRDPEFDDLMIKAGELTWTAGPVEKGPSLCHGTAGSAAALLKLFQRTDDDLWLDRARRLAMNAVEQSREHRRQYGQWRYSLWTGDLGLALLLHDCVRGRSELPAIDVL